MKRLRLANRWKLKLESYLEPKLVLPQENSDEHPLLQKYAQISQAALKNSPADLEAEAADDPPARVG